MPEPRKNNTVEQAVRQAESPGHALLILARAIDELTDQQPVAGDPWHIPDDPLFHPEPQPEPQENQAELIAQLADIEAELEIDTTSEQNKEVLNAKRRIIVDLLQGRALDNGDQGDRTLADQGTVTLPTPTAEQYAERYEFAENVIQMRHWEKELQLEEANACAAYAQGGPLWLYYGNRELVMQLPEHVRRAMVEDVEQFSIQEAQEMARDVLKFSTEEAQFNMASQAKNPVTAAGVIPDGE